MHFVVISDSALLKEQFPRNYVRTIVQTTIFSTKKYACTSTDDIFSLKILQI